MTQSHADLVSMLDIAAAEMAVMVADQLVLLMSTLPRSERRRQWREGQVTLEQAIAGVAQQMGLSEADSVRAMQKAADGFAARVKSISAGGSA